MIPLIPRLQYIYYIMAKCNFKQVSIFLFGVVLILLGTITHLFLFPNCTGFRVGIIPTETASKKFVNNNIAQDINVVERHKSDCSVLELNLNFDAGNLLAIGSGDASLLHMPNGKTSMTGPSISNGPIKAVLFPSLSAAPATSLGAVWIASVIDGGFLKMVEITVLWDYGSNGLKASSTAAGYVIASSFGVLSSDGLTPRLVDTAWKYKTNEADLSKYTVSNLETCLCRVVKQEVVSSNPVLELARVPTTTPHGIIFTASDSRMGGDYITNGPVRCVPFAEESPDRVTWIFAVVDGLFIKMVRMEVFSSDDIIGVKALESGYVTLETVGLPAITTSTLTTAAVKRAWSQRLATPYEITSVSYYILSS